MDKDSIISSLKPVFEKYGVIRASLFGSFSTNTSHNSSDIDILVELPKTKTGLDFVEYYSDLKDELERITKRKVDLVQYHLIKPALKSYIHSTEISIYI